ncbi:DUF742 domain-containing protein (plasmid) [Streptomyces sp. AM 4-1-1]|uniref:DUF742 domain-containing protein n=1 Tax=Streptomyces sp. AM 4-1-1 TaxID=3028710 RepID=UPI0023B91F87|nr:DUF742 domain-containing protein [Streptomyces sp. AM 4-1-1]WEH37874.1 DUF742 domain-containing protein [Streptomyces sp. AM 4-1-1]
MSGARQAGDDRLVRAYVVTGGRAAPSRNHFDHITLISLSASAGHLSRAPLNPEHLSILRVLAGGAQAVAELGALLRLPVSVTRVLLADLMEWGHITTQRRMTDTTTVDRALLEEVLAGLRRI